MACYSTSNSAMLPETAQLLPANSCSSCLYACNEQRVDANILNRIRRAASYAEGKRIVQNPESKTLAIRRQFGPSFEASTTRASSLAIHCLSCIVAMRQHMQRVRRFRCEKIVIYHIAVGTRGVICSFWFACQN